MKLLVRRIYEKRAKDNLKYFTLEYTKLDHEERLIKIEDKLKKESK